MSTQRRESSHLDGSTPRAVPTLFAGLVDDAAVFPPGSALLSDAVTAHRQHRASWYADLVGPLLVPASALDALPALLATAEQLEIGLIGDVPISQLDTECDRADERVRIRQIEAVVARRGEDPQPGLDRLLSIAAERPRIDVYAEIPLAWGLHAALDRLAEARSAGMRIAAKFRTGGLVAELFPTPMELAAVISACRERELPFKLTAGLHNALRHTDAATGFTHHGFLNVLAAAVASTEGAEVTEVAEVLAATDSVPLLATARARRAQGRPLWVGFGSCSIMDPLTDLIGFDLIHSDPVNGGYPR